MRDYPTLYLDTNSSKGTYLLTDVLHFTVTEAPSAMNIAHTLI